MSRWLVWPLVLSLVLVNLLGALAPVRGQETPPSEELCGDGIDGDGEVDESCDAPTPTAEITITADCDLYRVTVSSADTGRIASTRLNGEEVSGDVSASLDSDGLTDVYVEVVFDDGSVVTKSETLVTPPECAPAPTETPLPTPTATIASTSTPTPEPTSTALPTATSSPSPAAQPAKTAMAKAAPTASGGARVGASAVLTPALNLSLTTGKVGTSTIAGVTGFKANEAVTIRWYNGTTIVEVKTGTADSAGAAQLKFRVPAALKGAHKVEAKGSTSQATATYTVVPRVALSTYAAPAGTTLTVSLRGFGPREALELRWYEGSRFTVMARVTTTSATGSANTTFVVPRNASAGRHKLEAIRAGGNRGATTVTVTSGAATTTSTPINTATTTRTVTNIPSSTPSSTSTSPITATATPTMTQTPVPTATSTTLPTSTLTITPAPPSTSTNTAEPTSPATVTPTTTSTATATTAPTATATSTFTATPTPTNTSTPSDLPVIPAELLGTWTGTGIAWRRLESDGNLRSVADVFPISLNLQVGAGGSTAAALSMPSFNQGCWKDCATEEMFSLTTIGVYYEAPYTVASFRYTPIRGGMEVGIHAKFMRANEGGLRLSWEIRVGGVGFGSSPYDFLVIESDLARQDGTLICSSGGEGSPNSNIAQRLSHYIWTDGGQYRRHLTKDERSCVHRLDGIGPWAQHFNVWDLATSSEGPWTEWAEAPSGAPIGESARVYNERLDRVFQIDLAWLVKYGAVGGPAVLGAPTSNEYSAGGGSRRQDFELGYISLLSGVLTVTLFSDPMPSATPTPLPTTTPYRKPVVVYLEGVGSDTESVKDGGETVERQLRDRGLEYDVLTYSYNGGKMIPVLDRPGQDFWSGDFYACGDTSQWIGDSVNALRAMLRDYSRVYPGSEFILLGHSLGGVIAWTTTWQGTPALAQYDSRIAAVITFGSPLDRLLTYDPVFIQIAESWAAGCFFYPGAPENFDAAMFAVSLDTMLTADENNAEGFRLRDSGVLVLTYGSTGDEIYWADPGTLHVEADSGGLVCNFGDHGNYTREALFWDHLAIQLSNTFEGTSEPPPSC